MRRELYALIATGMLELVGSTRQASSPPRESVQPAPPPRREDEALRRELMALAERLRDTDPFEVFELTPLSSEAEVRAAFERLAPITHPDRVAGASDTVRKLAAELNQRIAEAYETLSDPARRGEYLRARQNAEREAKKREAERSVLDAELQFQYGEAALRQRDYRAAMECFRKAVDLNPDGGEYHAHFGWVLHLAHPGDKGKLAEAVGHVRRGLKLARDSEKPYLFMGRLMKAADRPEASEKMFGRAVQIQPDCFEALRELRLIKMRREKSKGFVRRLFRR